MWLCSQPYAAVPAKSSALPASVTQRPVCMSDSPGAGTVRFASSRAMMIVEPAACSASTCFS